jgi:Cdc6-like AAA superfamily ATPase
MKSFKPSKPKEISTAFSKYFNVTGNNLTCQENTSKKNFELWLEKSNFIEDIDNQESATLLSYGPSGAGKTSFITLLIQHLATTVPDISVKVLMTYVRANDAKEVMGKVTSEYTKLRLEFIHADPKERETKKDIEKKNYSSKTQNYDLYKYFEDLRTKDILNKAPGTEGTVMGTEITGKFGFESTTFQVRNITQCTKFNLNVQNSRVIETIIKQAAYRKTGNNNTSSRSVLYFELNFFKNGRPRTLNLIDLFGNEEALESNSLGVDSTLSQESRGITRFLNEIGICLEQKKKETNYKRL